MRVLLIGATDLTARVADTLEAIDEVEIAGLVTAPRTIRASYVPGGRPNVRHVDLRSWADDRSVPIHEYEGPAALREAVAAMGADLAVVAGWYHMVGPSVRALLPLGAVGLHASLLPELRGGAPLSWAILSGAERTGISLFVLTEEADEGPLYGQRVVPITPRTTVTELIEHTTQAGLELLRECLPAIASGALAPYPQEGTPSYCLHRDPADGRIDWTRSAAEIDRLVRAVTHPYPGAWTRLDDREVLVWAAHPLEGGPAVWSVPGGIARLPGVADPVVVTGDGLLVITEASDEDGADVVDLLRKSGHRRLG